MEPNEAFSEQELLIVEAFLGLLDEKPYGKVAVKELTGRCHIARTTFYRFFEDVDDLMNRIEEYLLGELVLYKRVLAGAIARDSAGAAVEGKPYESIRHWFAVGEKRRGMLRFVMGRNGDIYFKERLIARVRRELNTMMDDEGVVRDAMRPYYVAAIAASYVGLLHFMALQDACEPIDVDGLVRIANSMRVAYFKGDPSAPEIPDSRLFGAPGGVGGLP